MKQVLTALFLITFSVFQPISAAEGMKTVKHVIDRFEDFRKRLIEDDSQKVREQVNEEARGLVLSYIDLDEISRLALGRYYKSATDRQRKEFTGLFNELTVNRLVNINLPDKEKMKRELPLELKKESRRKDRLFNKDAIVVHTVVEGKRIDYEVDMYFYETDDNLKLYDIKVDGTSTILDFRNQFASIIRKKGLDYLIDKLRKRFEQIDKKNRSEK